MSVGTGLAIYFLIWWLTLFAVLPWGVKSQQESGTVSPGTDPGAPALSRLRVKLLWTTLVASALFGILYVVYERQIIGLDDFGWLLGPMR